MMLKMARVAGASPGGARGATGSLHLGGQKRLGKKYNSDVRDAHRRELRLGNTGDVRVTLGVPPKFLVVLRACPGPTGPANVAPGLRHRHNGPGSPGPLTGPLEGYPELPMLFC